MSKPEPKPLTWEQFEALSPGDTVSICFVEGGIVLEVNVASVDLQGGYINVDIPSGMRALVSLRQCYQNV